MKYNLSVDEIQNCVLMIYTLSRDEGGGFGMHAVGVMIYKPSLDEIQHVVLVKYTLCVMIYTLARDRGGGFGCCALIYG